MKVNQWLYIGVFLALIGWSCDVVGQTIDITASVQQQPGAWVRVLLWSLTQHTGDPTIFQDDASQTGTALVYGSTDESLEVPEPLTKARARATGSASLTPQPTSKVVTAYTVMNSSAAVTTTGGLVS